MGGFVLGLLGSFAPISLAFWRKISKIGHFSFICACESLSLSPRTCEHLRLGCFLAFLATRESFCHFCLPLACSSWTTGPHFPCENMPKLSPKWVTSLRLPLSCGLSIVCMPWGQGSSHWTTQGGVRHPKMGRKAYDCASYAGFLLLWVRVMCPIPLAVYGGHLLSPPRAKLGSGSCVGHFIHIVCKLSLASWG